MSFYYGTRYLTNGHMYEIPTEFAFPHGYPNFISLSTYDKKTIISAALNYFTLLGCAFDYLHVDWLDIMLGFG